MVKVIPTHHTEICLDLLARLEKNKRKGRENGMFSILGEFHPTALKINY